MIHAHHFTFIDQPSLHIEYTSFGFEVRVENNEDTITVKEIKQHNGFSERVTAGFLSGRQCYYLITKPFGDMNEDDDWGLEVIDVLTLAWNSASKSIEYGRGRLFTPELLRFWVLHTFFPMVLELEKKYKMLHVGAVEIEGAPVLFSAPSFGGKSTLTGYFLKQGHALYSDDTLAIRNENGCYVAYPSFPYHRPYREIESLGVRAKNFARDPKPVKAIYELVRVKADDMVDIIPLEGVEKFKTLLYSNFIKFRFMKKERFKFSVEMTAHIPVYQINIPNNLERLPEVYDAIIRHCRTAV